MRDLTCNETYTINGGINSNGYTFSNLVGATACGMMIGIPFTILTGQAAFIGGLGLLFGGYAAAMMLANILDQTVFSDPSPKTEEIIISQS